MKKTPVFDVAAVAGVYTTTQKLTYTYEFTIEEIAMLKLCLAYGAEIMASDELETKKERAKQVALCEALIKGL